MERSEKDSRPLFDDERLSRIPTDPGVYLLRDRNHKVVYVGKAKNLRGRVRMYFRGGDERLQVPFLVSRVADVETLVTRNEKEALILENNLIKQYKPRYNIRLKDDKSYVSVKVTLEDEWPRVFVTRKILRDRNRYFGPFHSASAVRDSLDAIRKVFPLRTCSDTVFRNRSRPCLEYQIKRCPGPCCLPVDREAYRGALKNAMLLLEGKNDELVRDLRARMRDASEALRFEEAARLRDQIRALERTAEPQEMVSHFGIDQDVFGFYREGGFIEVQVLAIRRGKLTGSHAYGLDDREFPDEEVLGEVLGQYYSGGRFIPDEVLVPVALEDAEVRASYLSELKGKTVAVFRPQRGDKVRLCEMAAENARQGFAARRNTEDRRLRMVEELRHRLELRSAPKRIECFDISNFQGRQIVGSMVAFDEGDPDKGRYRRYRVKSVAGQDDFASLYEVLKRRYSRALVENDLPDLLVVDGGKGQLGVASAVLAELGIRELDLVSLAKDRVAADARGREIRRSEERVFLPNRKNPVVLPRNSNALFLLQRVRDEAHRFAITFHRELRSRERFRSLLDDVPGVGPQRRRRLLQHFGSLRRLAAATAEEIAAVPGVGLERARAIAERLQAAPETGRPAGRRLVLKPIAEGSSRE
ncbi:MAG: excinuclease ABC subunit UvrC [Deltaproteobacteria bacterium]|nr:excinuclease ABC subunit UvrC [Deltaproteobacteria bacterium]